MEQESTLTEGNLSGDFSVNLSEHFRPRPKTYRVIRFVHRWPVGTIEETLGRRMTLDEAEEVIKNRISVIQEEDLVIEEESDYRIRI